jgi:uncharacterized membrane protein
MTINATWALGTVLTLLLQAAFVVWQMRFVRSFDRLTAARRSGEAPPTDAADLAESRA